jgi:hypothetical protein
MQPHGPAETAPRGHKQITGRASETRGTNARLGSVE